MNQFFLFVCFFKALRQVFMLKMFIVILIYKKEERDNVT